MEVLVVLAHPDPGSFNHALAGAAVDAARELGANVTLRDLHAEGFDPVRPSARGRDADADIARYRAEARSADGIVVVHPVWFFAPPAIIKGWVDRVLHELMAIRPEERGGLAAEWALVFNTGNAPQEYERDVLGDPLDTFWRRCVFRPGGVERFGRTLFAPMKGSGVELRRAWLDRVRSEVLAAGSGRPR